MKILDWGFTKSRQAVDVNATSAKLIQSGFFSEIAIPGTPEKNIPDTTLGEFILRAAQISFAGDVGCYMPALDILFEKYFPDKKECFPDKPDSIQQSLIKLEKKGLLTLRASAPSSILKTYSMRFTKLGMKVVDDLVERTQLNAKVAEDFIASYNHHKYKPRTSTLALTTTTAL